MMDSIPDACTNCGTDDLNIKTERTNTNGGARVVTVNCNQCGTTIVDRERLNYKTPVMHEETDE